MLNHRLIANDYMKMRQPFLSLKIEVRKSLFLDEGIR